MEAVTLEKINKNINDLRRDIIEIKEHMVGVDTILTYDDIESLQEAEKDLAEGKTKRIN